MIFDEEAHYGEIIQAIKLFSQDSPDLPFSSLEGDLRLCLAYNFADSITSSLEDSSSVFKAAWLLQVMQPDVDTMDCLQIFTFVKSNSTMEVLKTNLSFYKAKSVGI